MKWLHRQYERVVQSISITISSNKNIKIYEKFYQVDESCDNHASTVWEESFKSTSKFNFDKKRLLYMKWSDYIDSMGGSSIKKNVQKCQHIKYVQNLTKLMMIVRIITSTVWDGSSGSLIPTSSSPLPPAERGLRLTYWVNINIIVLISILFRY